MHLELHLRRIRRMLCRYTRRFAARFAAAGERYTDDCVGRLEVQAALTSADLPDTWAPASAWLDALGVAPLDDCERALVEADEALARWLGEGSDGRLPLEELRASFRLTPLELDALIVAAAPRLSEALARLYRFAWVDFTRVQPTAGFLCDLIRPASQPTRETLALFEPGATLRRCRLVEVHESERWRPRTPLLHAPVSVPQRVLDFILGRDAQGAPLRGCVLQEAALEPAALVLGQATRAAVERALRRPRARLGLLGPRGVGRRTVLQSLIASAGQRVLEVDLAAVLDDPSPSSLLTPPSAARSEETRLAEALREARLHHAVALLRLDDLDDAQRERLRGLTPRLRPLLTEDPGALALSAPAPSPLLDALLGAQAPQITFGAPPRAGQQTLWTRALRAQTSTERATRLAKELARRYQLTPGAIARAAEAALASRRPRRDLDLEALVRAARRQLDHDLGWLADSYEVMMDLDEVVLDAGVREQLALILRFARQADTVFGAWGFGRHSPDGRGLSALFAGPPGTGKTLCAGVIARALGRSIYRVDLSRVVDKYIGETEKNLGRVFDEAERAQAVLLFDEADSLFGARTSVRSSNDRYANLEVNYLLQRIDAFGGVAILTTNLASGLDEAFQRRLRFHVSFPKPDATQRAELWRRLLPPEAPLDEPLRLEALGEAFELMGGHIKNAVLRAAIEAADAGCPISDVMLWRAGVAECEALGSLISVREPFETR